ncbi:DUF7089 family protein [Haloarchaeobius amylolyticus]|uniref:DUF7089 family protein n=1 Tax=Haloarchaeobius amylolyticus TaxID=1198296 RepID=UPI0022714A32|nr:hypothetical protein [Haloarchaeobius amylolyticus]
MFSERDLSPSVAAVRDEHAPGALVLDAATDFETIPPAQAEDLGLLVDSLSPTEYDPAWVPEEAPELLHRLAGNEFTIGAPGDGSVAWTRQTDPPVVIVKPRVEGSPESFIDFLVAEALVEAGLDVPEHFLGFFAAHYRDLADATPLDPNATYQVAAALYDGWLGLHTRDVFADWLSTQPALGEAWQDAGSRLEGRLDGLAREVALGQTDFSDATELACSGLKHAVELPAPFAALDTDAYRDRGAPYAVKWAEKTFESLQ